MHEELTKAVLAQSSGPHVLEGQADLQAASCQMAGQCKQRLLIYTQRLSHPIYDQPCFVDAVKALAIRHGRSRIRILVADTEPIRLNGHRLLNLARRLSSSIEFRLRSKELSGDTRSFLLADEVGYILRPVWHDLHDCQIDYNNRFLVRKLEEEFVAAWEQSEPDPDLRQLSI